MFAWVNSYNLLHHYALESLFCTFRLSLSLTASGDLQLWSNSHCYGAHLTDLPIQNPMWLIVDIFGSTQAVQFHREDNVPIEILARGPEALEAYSKLRKLGTAQLFRGRVFLAGLDR